MADQQKTASSTVWERWKIWSAALLSGLVPMTGCGGDSSESAAADPSSETTDLIPGQRDQEGGLALSNESLLQTSPDQWLQSQVKTAFEMRSAKSFSEEVKTWEQTINGLENRAGSGYWVTAGARMGLEVATRLSELDNVQLQDWDDFQKLDQEIGEEHARLKNQFRSGQLERTEFQQALLAPIQKCDQQQKIIESLFGQKTHLLANIAFRRAELLADREQYIAALVEAERSLMIRQMTIKVQHPDTLASLKLMGRLAEQAQKYDIARDCFSNAVSQANNVWGNDHLNYAEHANDLGVFYYGALGKRALSEVGFADASHWLQTALHIRQTKLGENNLLTALSRRNLAQLKLAEAMSKDESSRMLELVAAEENFDKALPVFRTQATDQSMLAQVLIESATAKMLVGEYETAEKRLREVRDGELAEFNPSALSLTVEELDFRIAAACLKQISEEKEALGRALIAELVEKGKQGPSYRRIADRAHLLLTRYETAQAQDAAVKDLPVDSNVERLADESGGIIR